MSYSVSTGPTLAADIPAAIDALVLDSSAGDSALPDFAAGQAAAKALAAELGSQNEVVSASISGHAWTGEDSNWKYDTINVTVTGLQIDPATIAPTPEPAPAVEETVAVAV